jgi:hypothetical protein
VSSVPVHFVCHAFGVPFCVEGHRPEHRAHGIACAQRMRNSPGGDRDPDVLSACRASEKINAEMNNVLAIICSAIVASSYMMLKNLA